MGGELKIKLDKGKIEGLLAKGQKAFIEEGVKKELFQNKKITPIKGI